MTADQMARTLVAVFPDDEAELVSALRKHYPADEAVWAAKRAKEWYDAEERLLDGVVADEEAAAVRAEHNLDATMHRGDARGQG